MRAAFAGLGSLALLAIFPAHAQPRLVVSLSASQVEIGSNYTGAQIVLFGTVEHEQAAQQRPPLDIVVTVRGPRDTVSVRRKEALGPIWINRGQEKFAGVPSVLAILTSRPIGEIATPAVRARYRLGIDAVVNAPELTLGAGQVDDAFRKALVRLRARDGLWREDMRGVTWITGAFFRAPVPLTGATPTGNYEVEAVLLSGGAPVAQRTASFEVVKTGLEEQVTSFAERHAMLYGLGIGALSLAFGWLASVIFRRD